MKKRWMTSVIEASKQDIPAMPFQRRVYGTKIASARQTALRKTA